MSMTCYAGRIEVQISGTGTVSFEYEFDNEICPRIARRFRTSLTNCSGKTDSVN